MSISNLTGIATSVINLTAGSTTYQKIGNFALGISTTESDNQIEFVQVANLLYNMFITVKTNASTSGSANLILRINGADANQNISIPFGTTGDFVDNINTDTYSSSDLLNFKLTGATGGTVAYSLISIFFDGGAGVCLQKFVNTNHTSSTDSIQEFFPFVGNIINLNTAASTDANCQVKYQTAATLKNITLNCNSNTRITDTIYNSRINAATGNLSITVSALTTGLFSDTSNSDSISINDLVNGMITTDVGGGSISVRYIGFESITTNDKNHFIISTGSLTSQTFSTSLIRYIILNGIMGSATTDINSAKCNLSFSASYLSCYLISNTITAQSTIILQKNSAEKTSNITIPASTSGFFEDTTNSDFFKSTDLINYKLTTGSTGVNLILPLISILVDYAALPPKTTNALFFAGD